MRERELEVSGAVWTTSERKSGRMFKIMIRPAEIVVPGI